MPGYNAAPQQSDTVMFLRLSRPLFRAVFVVAVIVVFVLTMAPLPTQIDVVSNQDKFEHGFAFFALMLLGWAGWPQRATRVAGGLVAYGLLIEICQHTLTAYRSGDALDWLADSVGVGIGCLVVRRLTILSQK